jgi:hypothetical protein
MVQTQTVTIKRIKNDAWLGIKKYPGTEIEKIPVGLDAKTGERKRVLTEQEEKEFEKELGYEPGTLARNSSFWVEFYVPLGIETELDLSDPTHRLYLKVLETKKIVAKSMSQKTAYTEYVIHKEVEEARIANKSLSKKKEAFKKFADMSVGEMITILTAMGKKPTNTNPEVVERTLGEIVDSNPDKFLEIANNPDLDIVVFLNKLKNQGIVQERAKQFIYGDYRLGQVQEAIDFLKDPDNSDVYLSLQKQLKDTE